MTEGDFRSRVIFSVMLCAVSLLAFFVAWNGRYILLLIFGGVVGALLLSGPTSWVQARLRIKRTPALFLVLFALGGLLAGLGALRGPALVQQMSMLQEDLPASAQQMMTRLNAETWGQWITTHVRSSAGSSDGFSVAVSGIRGLMSMTTLTIAGMIVVLFTSIFLAAEPEFYLRGLRRLTPVVHRAMLDQCLAGARASLQSWLVAKVISMVAIGTMVTVGLWILRVPLPATLGIIAGLLTFIPNLGPIVSAIPAALLAFAISPGRALLVLSLFGLVHFVEGNIVTPLAERNIVTLPPALTLAVQLLLASMTGALGLALAAPITAVFLGVFQVLTPPETKTRTLDESLDAIPAGVR